MKTTLDIEVAPIFVPTMLECKIGEMHENVPVTEFSSETLAALCDEFRENVFKAAGKEPPPKAHARPITQREAALALVRDVIDHINKAPPWDIEGVRIKLLRVITSLKE